MENDERKRAKGEMLEALIILKFPLALSYEMYFRIKKNTENILKHISTCATSQSTLSSIRVN